MTRLFRPVAAGLLALLLIVTAQTMAEARGMARPVGEMVLCTGTGPLMVPVDANGQPTGPPHVCPDFTLSLILAAPGADDMDFLQVWRALDRGVWRRSGHAGRDVPVPSARGPPLGA